MKVSVGADHGGFEMKNQIEDIIKQVQIFATNKNQIYSVSLGNSKVSGFNTKASSKY